MGDVASPNISQFAEVLSQEPDWYTLGIFLDAPTHKLDAIGLHFRGDSCLRCLIELYKCLESQAKTPSWEFIAKSLRRMNNHSLADKIKANYSVIPSLNPSRSLKSSISPSSCTSLSFSSLESDSHLVDTSMPLDVPCEITKDFLILKKKLTNLIITLKTSLVNSAVDIGNLQIAIKSMCGLKPLVDMEATFEAIFFRLEGECTIIVYDILVFIRIETFLPNDTSLCNLVKEFNEGVNQFMSSAKMMHLVDLVRKRQENSNKSRLVRLKVREFWNRFTILQFENVLQNLFKTLLLAAGCNLEIVTA